VRQKVLTRARSAEYVLAIADESPGREQTVAWTAADFQEKRSAHYVKRIEAMRKANSFAAKKNSWELLSANMRPHLTDMPFLQPMAAELDGVITEANVLDSEQELARKRLSDIIHRRQELEKQGEKIRTRIGAHLKGNFGFTSDELIQFGIAPRPRVIRRKKPAPEPV
jgi:hypothetical protein